MKLIFKIEKRKPLADAKMTSGPALAFKDEATLVGGSSQNNTHVNTFCLTSSDHIEDMLNRYKSLHKKG